MSTQFFITSPLDQFVIRDLISVKSSLIGNIGFSLTNIGLYLTISLLIVLFLGEKSLNVNKIVASK
jgi:F-type H+-transporting ATPase subunit a